MGRSYLSHSIHGSSKQQKETTRLQTWRGGFCTSLEVYLSGWKSVIRTDHRALALLQSAKQLLEHLYRWALLLQRFDFNIRYRTGLSNLNADGLSRQAWTKDNEDQQPRGREMSG